MCTKHVKDSFQQYGSHVSSGLIKFGGISFRTCSSNDFSQDEGITLKKVQDSAILATDGVNFSENEY